ncbi:hypothetical protein COCOBI_13-0140 [Coccomyxa sp. Obi]|nr:hypothetical protein COCOBI_13-0140 [Coccomyxa sp. Obi]
MGSIRQLGSGQSQSSEVTRMAVNSPAQPAPSVMDQYFMPPHLAPPPGYLSVHKAEPLPRAPSCHQSSGKHRKTEEQADWQGIPHLRKIGPDEDKRLSTRCGPDYVVVHGVPEHCKRLLEDMVKPVRGFEYLKFYNPRTCNTSMAVIVFANRSAAEQGFTELFHSFNSFPVGMSWRPEKIMLVNRKHVLPARERTIKLKALIDASNPEQKDVPASAAPACPAGEMPPPLPREAPHSSVPSFPEANQPPLPPDPNQAPLPSDPDEAMPPPPPDQAPLPGGPDQALPPLPTSTPPPLPPPDDTAAPLPDVAPLPPWAEGTTVAGRPVPWKSAAEEAMPPPWAKGTGAAEPLPPWANGTVDVNDLPPHLQKAVKTEPPPPLSSGGPPLSGAPGAPEPGHMAGRTGEASNNSRPTPKRPWKQPTGRRPVPAYSQHGPSKTQVQAPEVHARCAQAAAAPQIADQGAAKGSSTKPASTTKPAQPRTGANHVVRKESSRRSSSQERTGDRRRRSPSLDTSFRGQVSGGTSLERRPSERRSADRTRRDTSERPGRSPSPRRTSSRGASLDRRRSGQKSADRTRRDAGPRSRRTPSPTRPQDRSRTGRDRDARERPHSARRSGSSDRERRSADRRAASERRHSARRSRSPDQRRGSDSGERERLRADKRSPERPRPRSRSVQRQSSSLERRETGPGGRLTPKVKPLPPPPRRAGRDAAERRDGPAEQRKPGSPSTQQSQSSAPAQDQLKQVLSNGPSDERPEKRPRLQVSAAELPGPEPLKSVKSGCTVLKQDQGGSQMAAAARDNAQPGASSQKQAERKRPRESSVHGSDSSAGKRQPRAAADTACKRVALQRSADLRSAAQKPAPLLSQVAALDESQQVELREPQSGANPAARPAKQLASPGCAKAQAPRTVAVADDSNGHSWQAAANGDRRVWVDNQPRCAEQLGNQPHHFAEAGPSGGQSTCLEEWMPHAEHPAQIDPLKTRHSSEQHYSTAEDCNFASNSGVDRVVHMGRQPVSLEMNGNPHRHARDPSSMPKQIKHIDVGAPNDMTCPSSLHDGSKDHTQASSLPSPHRGLHGKDRVGNAPLNSPIPNGSAKRKSKQAGTTNGARNKQAMVKGTNLERLPEELTRRIRHLLTRDDLRPEHFTKTIVAKLAALELPFAHKAVDWMMDQDWSTTKSVPSELGQLIKQAELEANREFNLRG